MSFKKTLLFFLIFAFIGTYYYVIEIKKAEKIKEIEQEEKRVFSSVKKEEISEVTVEQENKKTIRLVRESNTWKIKEPVEADVDEESLKIWLDYVAELQKERVVSESSENISEFGLDKPVFTVHVKDSGGSAVTLISGDEIPTGSMFYSKLKSEDTIFLITAYNKNGIDKSVYELRDKKIFHFEKEDVQGFKIDSAAGKYSVEKKDGTWQVVEPKQAPADIEKIISMLQKIRTTDIKKFIAEETDNLILYGLKDPHTKITFFIGEDKTTHILDLGKENAEDEGIYARTSSKNNVFLLKKEFLNEFPYTVYDIRDKSIIRFDKDKTNKMQFIFPDKTITTVKNEENNWEIIEPIKAKADDYEINSLLNDINDRKIIDFIPESDGQEHDFALKNPRLTLKLFQKDNSKPKVISFGAGNKPRKSVYANTGSPDEVVLVDNETFDKLNITEMSLRYKRLLVLNEDEIARIKIKAEGKEYLISKKKDEWFLDKPGGKILETIKAKEILWSLGDIKFTDIIDESGEVDLAAFGLQKPSIKVNLLDDKENNLESLFIGTKIEDDDSFFAMTGKSKTIYSIKQKLNDELLSSIKSLVSIEPQSDTKER